MLSLIGLGLMWVTLVILIVLYTVDDDQTSRRTSRAGKKEPTEYPGNYSGLGGELQRLEEKFEGAELVFARAEYIRDDPRHKEAKEQLRQLRRQGGL